MPNFDLRASQFDLRVSISFAYEFSDHPDAKKNAPVEIFKAKGLEHADKICFWGRVITKEMAKLAKHEEIVPLVSACTACPVLYLDGSSNSNHMRSDYCVAWSVKGLFLSGRCRHEARAVT